MALPNTLLDWLDSRTGWRTGRRKLLEEPIQAGVGWWFVTGSILLMLLTVQFVTGVALAMFYVPAPDHAYDSIRFIMERLTFGHVLRGLHFFGASFIVVAAVVHMLRVVALGSYKNPREVTWITGVVLLLVILGFALTGYLLPWDQKAYWATTVTINIARSGPFGEQVAGLLQGGTTLGSLTLLRWYAAHVFLLPSALIGFVIAHLFLMRRHDRWRVRLRAAPHVRDRVSRAARSDRGSIRRCVRASTGVVLPQPLSTAEVLPGSARAAGDDGDSCAGGGAVVAAAVSRSAARSALPQAAPRDRRFRHHRPRDHSAHVPRVQGHASAR
jgi:hypothetical protein